MAIYRRNGPLRMSQLQAFIQPTLQFNISQSELYRGGPNVPSQGWSSGTPGEYLITVDEDASSDGNNPNEQLYVSGFTPTGLVHRDEVEVSDNEFVSNDEIAWTFSPVTSSLTRPDNIRTNPHGNSGFSFSTLNGDAGERFADLMGIEYNFTTGGVQSVNSNPFVIRLSGTLSTGPISFDMNIGGESHYEATGASFRFSLRITNPDDLPDIDLRRVEFRMSTSNVLPSITLSNNLTFEFPEGLTTPLQFRDNLLPRLQATSAIADRYNITGATLTTPRFIPQENLYSGLLSSLRVNYNESGRVDHNGLFSFTNAPTETEAVPARTFAIPLPDTRPITGSIVVQYRSFPLSEGITFTPALQNAFNGIGINDVSGFRVTNSDVARYNRRLVVNTANFNASYRIDRFATGISSVKVLQFFELSDGRDVNVREQSFIDSIPPDPDFPERIYTLFMVSSEFVEEIGSPIIEFEPIGTQPLINITSRENNDGLVENAYIQREGLSSEIQIDFGAGVEPQTIDIDFGGVTNNGLVDRIVTEIENHPQFFSDLSAPRNVRIEDSRQRFLDRPIVTVTEPGSSGLQDSDFLRFTQTTGVPPTTTFNFNRNYDNLDARPLTDGDWNFQNGSGTTASNIQPTAWPTTGNAFVAFREQPGGLLTAGGAFATFLGLSSFSGSQSFTDLTLTLTAGTNTVTYPVTAINVIGQDLIATVTAGSSRDLNGTPPANGTATTFNWLRGTFGEINTSVPESGTISLSDLYGVNDGENT